MTEKGLPRSDLMVGIFSLAVIGLVWFSVTRNEGFLAPRKKVEPYNGKPPSIVAHPPVKEEGRPLNDPSQPHDVASANAFFESGRLKQQAEDFKGAITDYKEACRLDPIRKFYWSALGDAYRLDNDPEQSATCFQHVYDLDVFDTGNLINLGFVTQGMRRDVDARRTYVMALAIQPDLGDAWTELYNVARGLGMEQFYQPLKHLSTMPNDDINFDIVYRINNAILEDNPDDYYCLVNRALMNNRYLRFGTVEADVTRALKIRKDGPAALIARAQMLAGLGETDKAIAAYKQCLAVSQQPVAYAELGALTLQAGNLDEAIHDYGMATELGNDKPSWVATYNALKAKKANMQQASAPGGSGAK